MVGMSIWQWGSLGSGSSLDLSAGPGNIARRNLERVSRRKIMRKTCCAGLLMAITFSLGVSLAAQQQAPAANTSSSVTPSIDQSLEMKGAFNPEISPDGKRVVYEVSRTNWEDNAFERDLWIADAAGGDTHQLTASKKSSTNPAWSPDGK